MSTFPGAPPSPIRPFIATISTQALLGTAGTKAGLSAANETHPGESRRRRDPALEAPYLSSNSSPPQKPEDLFDLLRARGPSQAEPDGPQSDGKNDVL
jgi:hypothetical protein